MAIPDFNAEGLLPPGPHGCSEGDVKVKLVDPFAGSSTRTPIHQRWELHRLALAEFLAVEEQWVDGSFVTDKVDPDDVDIVTLFDGPAFDALPVHRKMIVGTLVANKYTAAYWHCDSYALPVYPDGHANKPKTDAALAYWTHWFGHTRDGKDKGYLRVTT